MGEEMTIAEGPMKRKVKQILRRHSVYYFMPVQYGYGAAGLDFHAVIKWFTVPIAFFVETKAPGKLLTMRQRLLRDYFETELNAKVFVIDNNRGLEELENWILKLTGETQKHEQAGTDLHLS